MIEVLILRHGQSLADLEDRHEGRADFPLTDLGREQACRAAVWICNKYPPSKIYSSPLLRASETAMIVSHHMNLPVQYDEDLMEFNNGLIAGLLRAEAEEKYPTPVHSYKAHEAVPGGESMIDFRARAERVWSKIITSAFSNDRICIVAHGGIISMLFCSFLNLPIQCNIRVSTADTGIHLWKISETNRQIVFTNSSNHLIL